MFGKISLYFRVWAEIQFEIAPLRPDKWSVAEMEKGMMASIGRSAANPFVYFAYPKSRSIS